MGNISPAGWQGGSSIVRCHLHYLQWLRQHLTTWLRQPADLKSPNLLVDANWTAKVGGCESARTSAWRLGQAILAIVHSVVCLPCLPQVTGEQ